MLLYFSVTELRPSNLEERCQSHCVNSDSGRNTSLPSFSFAAARSLSVLSAVSQISGRGLTE